MTIRDIIDRASPQSPVGDLVRWNLGDAPLFFLSPSAVLLRDGESLLVGVIKAVVNWPLLRVSARSADLNETPKTCKKLHDGLQCRTCHASFSSAPLYVD